MTETYIPDTISNSVARTKQIPIEQRVKASVISSKSTNRGLRYHSGHESAHAVVGLELGLTPKTVLVGRTKLGTSGGIEFCSIAARNRDPKRYLMILVAGRVGTRLLGYNNRLVSEQLARLRGEEPADASDEWYVWDDHYPLAEVQEAEIEVRQILERKHVLLLALTEALVAKRKLCKDEVRAIVAKCRSRH